MPFDYAVPSVPDGSRIDYSDGLLDNPVLALVVVIGVIFAAIPQTQV
jgi:hypothetical protein